MATKVNFERVRSLTEAVLKIKPNQTRFVYIGTPMHMGKKVTNKGEPVQVRALDMETGEQGLLFCGAVLQSELWSQYGGEKAEYVGKGFELTMTRQQDRESGEKGAAYNHYSISEVTVPDEIAKALPKFEQPKKEALAPANKKLAEAAAARAAAIKG